MSAPAALWLVANARLPSQRAQSLQVLHAAAAFARAGVDTTLLHARRVPTPALPAGTTLFDHYGVPAGARPAVAALPCVDWIDRVPRRLQFLPARVQELTFARAAARAVRAGPAGAFVLSRELETARLLAGRPGVFLEVHRVPGGATRRRWLRDALRATAGCLAISGGVRDDLLALGATADAVRVEHDAYEPGLFAGVPSRAGARRVLGLDPERPVVVYTGGLLAWKGVDMLVEAAAAVPDADVVVVGGMDADAARLRERAAGRGNVRVLGFRPPAEVPTWLAAADVGVVPNRSQPAISARYTSPLKVFEAMAAGLPLVASDLPSLREVLGEDDAVFFAPDDAGALGRALRSVLDDGALRARLGERLRARAAEHTYDARARRILDWMASRAG